MWGIKDLVVTGTGRCGTAYMAKVLESAGVPCQHEGTGTDDMREALQELAQEERRRALSSWLAAPFLNQRPLQDARVVHLVRHPQRVMESLLRIGFFEGRYPEYLSFANEHLPGLEEQPSGEAKAAHLYVKWNEMIERQCDGRQYIRHRVEDDPAFLLDQLGIIADGDLYRNTRLNSRAGAPVDVDITKWPEVFAMAERYGYELEPPQRQPQVFWAALMERCIYDVAANALMDVAMTAGLNGYARISVPYGRTDAVRNLIVDAFRNLPGEPDDVLIMVDCDHAHPPDILPRLAMRPEGVVAALAFRRSAPFEPMWFVRRPNGRLQSPAEFEPGLYECQAAGTGAIAVKRWVFDDLAKRGHEYFFRYEYREDKDGWRSSEDMHFAKLCEDAGIPHYVDCTLEIPHLRIDVVDSERWRRYRDEHPEIVHVETDGGLEP